MSHSEYQAIHVAENNSLLFLSTRLKLWKYIVAVRLQLLSHGWMSRCAKQWCLVDTVPLWPRSSRFHYGL
jgi:hypothetical protein